MKDNVKEAKFKEVPNAEEADVVETEKKSKFKGFIDKSKSGVKKHGLKIAAIGAGIVGIVMIDIAAKNVVKAHELVYSLDVDRNTEDEETIEEATEDANSEEDTDEENEN